MFRRIGKRAAVFDDTGRPVSVDTIKPPGQHALYQPPGAAVQVIDQTHDHNTVISVTSSSRAPTPRSARTGGSSIPTLAQNNCTTPRATGASSPPLTFQNQLHNNKNYTIPQRYGDDIDHYMYKVDEAPDDKYRTVTSVSTEDVTVQTPPYPPNDSPGLRCTSSLTDNTSHEHHHRTKRETFSSSVSSETATINTMEEERRRPKTVEDLYQLLEEEEYYRTKQRYAYVCMVISTVQLLILTVQLCLCGVAPIDVNPFVGPFPDTISQWGGKNPFMMKEEGQWFRLITPAFLHVGILQLLVNVAVQLETCAFFEREWGSMRFLWIYVLGEVACVICSSTFLPNSIAVGSSGALMGTFGAKLAQVLTSAFFDFSKKEEDSIRLEQLTSVLCSLSVVLALSFFTYIDWVGHMGAMACGFIIGIISFSRPIRNRISRTVWRLFGLILLFTALPMIFYVFLEIVEPDEDLGDVCNYFRNLYTEDYDCACSSLF